ncbi:hypothetical protein HBI56_189680 [Parastagonospora nodorum]|uniref:DUF7730 domain-containing protein n=1 Tax=Phaeosphaeria nodorum (strain SN15 / ATCC MYA-4574 / FGSC 10173) TaxID=321614 RepID=A0A7U2F9X4_PHANO|nr:hypothetical protein HBH56_144780 [Parastagonospora nodorum]QRD01382.1 hypothetical protein JI435_120530 [Parastagonospora nodorum SN15]KAH3927576.1 hypothetical protein HBH54_149970 [Parastagonospora nodorum]KAH3960241.1 hypothetical protein HBH51_193830 [Parastagonospora nodorum]KAH3970931.1 hypothetical protein HBH52_161510 [Parastagonospora nodorum]
MAEHSPERFTRFLDLPRELRDCIYELILVRDVIPVECAITNTRFPQGSEEDPEYCTIPPLRAPRAQRRLWQIPAFDMDLGYPDNDHTAPETVHMTYQISKEPELASLDGLNLCLLQVSKQVYTEASKIFYSNNTFSFTQDLRLPTAFAFLCDRPAASLRMVRSIELALMEDSNMRGTAQAHYPIIRRSTDSLVLQYAYHYFTELCTLLSTSRIQLRKLYLSVETCGSRGSQDATSLQETVTWENENLNSAALETLWLEPLLKLEGLESVEIHWIFGQAHVRRMAYMAQKIQRHSLARMHEDSVSEGLAQRAHPPIRITSFHKSEQGTSFVSQDPSKWEHVVLEGEEIRYVPQEECGKNEMSQATELPRHLQWMLDIFADACVCRCTLRCT